ncbi:MAG: hypothetical protein WDW38_005808 [Sanguina aurantia]
MSASSSSTSFDIRCRAARLRMDEVTLAVSAHHRTSPDHASTFSALRAVHERFQGCYPDLTHVHPTLIDVQGCYTTSPAAPSTLALMAEHRLFLPSFAALLAALLPRMDRALFATHSLGSDRDTDFTLLWSVLHTACLTFDAFPTHWPKGHLQDGSPLYPALLSLMRFLLPLTTTTTTTVNSTADNKQWAPPLGRAIDPLEILALIKPAWSTFNGMCNATRGGALVASLLRLPATFVQTLCLLGCDRLTNALLPLQVPAVTDVFVRLTRSLAACVAACFHTGRGDVIASLCTPASLEVAKRGFVLMQTVEEDHQCEVRQMLCLFFRSYELQGAPGGYEPIHPRSNWSRNRAPGGVATLSPAMTTPEGVLLRALCRETPGDLQVMEVDLSLMSALIQSWPGADGGHTASGVPSENIGCIMQMARHVSQFVQGWMAGMQAQQRLEQGQAHGQQGQATAVGSQRGHLSQALAMRYQHVMKVLQRLMRLVCMHSIMHVLPDMATWQRSMQQLRAPEQQQRHNRVLKQLLKLHAWKRSPGCLLVVEVTMRDVHRPSGTGDLTLAIDVVIRMLVPPCDSHDPEALPAVASLAATIRKLLHAHTNDHTQTQAGSQQNTFMSYVFGNSERPSPGQLDVQSVANLMEQVFATILAIDRTLQTELARVGVAPTGSSRANAVSSSSPPASPRRNQLLKQALATLMFCLLQMCAWRVRVKEAQSPGSARQGWFRSLERQLAQLGAATHPISKAAMQVMKGQEWMASGQQGLLDRTYEGVSGSVGGTQLPGPIR